MSSSPIDTPAMIAALEKAWLKTKTTKTAAAFIAALQADLDEANEAIGAINDDPDKRANVELKVALDVAQSELDAAQATVAQLQEELRIERLTHNNMSAALREADATTSSSILPPSDLPPPDTIALAVAAESKRCAALALGPYGDGWITDRTYEDMDKPQYGEAVRIETARRILVPVAAA